MMRFNEYINHQYNKVIGWGTGGYYKDNIKHVSGLIDYLIDKDIQKQNMYIQDKMVYNPNILKDEDPQKTIIVIFSSFYEEIVETICEYGDFSTIDGKLFNDIIKCNTNIFCSQEDKVITSNIKEDNIILSLATYNSTIPTNGSSKFIKEQIRLLNMYKKSSIHLCPLKCTIRAISKNRLLLLQVDNELIGLSSIEQVLEEIKIVQGIIVHSLYEGLDTLTLILKQVTIKTKLLYYIHDFACICSSIFLDNGSGHCRSYDLNWEPCTRCQYNYKREVLYQYYKEFFKRKDVILVAPSISTKNIIQKAFEKLVNIKVLPHQIYEIKTNSKIINDKIRIAYVGSAIKLKGWEEFKKIFYRHRNQYEFYCFGKSEDIIEGINYVDVCFEKDGLDGMTKKLEEYKIDIGYLGSICPETYSYTYYECYVAGVFVITNKLSGNIADQVDKNKNGISVTMIEELEDILNNEAKLIDKLKRNKKKIYNIRINDAFIDEIN
jgi:hypothetical protein